MDIPSWLARFAFKLDDLQNIMTLQESLEKFRLLSEQKKALHHIMVLVKDHPGKNCKMAHGKQDHHEWKATKK